MNPLTTIRPWILACCKQWGLKEVHEYRWHDPDNKSKREPYATFRMVAFEPEDEGVHDLTTASGYNAVTRASQPWIETVHIDMHNSQNGLYELASCCVAIDHHPSIMELFRGQGSLVDRSVEDLSTFDDEEIIYHHRLTCTFRVNVEHSLTETNGIVDDIVLQLDDGTYYDEYTINDEGYGPTP